MFSENITNVHCSPEHCDDLLNSSRFCDVFLFFVIDVHWSPKHYDDLLNSSRFYDVFLFFITDVTWWIFKPRTLRRIPIFRHGCALMDIQAQNTVMYSCFSSRMWPDGYSSPEHCDVFLFFVTDVPWWIFKPRTLWCIPVFRHRCALMDIQTQNTAIIY
jgi:hypothetical protein